MSIPMTDSPSRQEIRERVKIRVRELFDDKNRMNSLFVAMCGARPGNAANVVQYILDMARASLSASPPIPVPSEERALADVVAERRRQVESEGWTAAHDDEHESGALAMAAACYAFVGGFQIKPGLNEDPNPNVEAANLVLRWWPWDEKWWKPKDKRRNLVKAGALILAEIERIDRAALVEKE